MVSDLNVLVLAAGKSTRIATVSKGLPKPLMTIQGRSILEHNLRWLANQGIKSIWINLHYKADEIKQAIGSGAKWGLDIHYSFEPEILGTAGAYKKLEDQFPGTTLVVYGDNMISFDLLPFHNAHVHSRAAATIALFDQNLHEHTGIAGGKVVMDAQGRVIEFLEAKNDFSGSCSTAVNAGVYLLEPQVSAFIPSGTFWDFGRDVFPKMLQTAQNLRGYMIEQDGYCLGLDLPQSFEKGLHLIQTGRVKLR